MPAESLIGHMWPELILLIASFGALFLGLAGSESARQWVSPLTCAAVVLALLVTLLGAGASQDVMGFGLRIGPLTHYVRVITLGIGTLIVLVNWHQPVAGERGEYMAMILYSLLGVLLTASANDMVVLFFAIELVSVPTYVLVALSRTDQRASEAAVKYFFLGALAAAILAYGLSFLYGVAGTTRLHTPSAGAVLAGASAATDVGAYFLIGMLLVIAGLAFKIAAVPLHVYAADVYEGAASPITGMLAFVPKLAGFVALIKVFSACAWALPPSLMWVLWLMAAATMTVGNVLALLQHNVKRMLAYSSIAHSGYMLIALLVGPIAGEGPMKDGVAALLFYIGVYGAMNLGVFALLSAFKSADREIETLDDLSGLAVRAPLAAFALAVCVFSLMGFPPTAGFLGKLYIFSSAFSLPSTHAFQGPLVALAIIGVVNSAIAAAYYLRIVSAVYMGAEIEPVAPVARRPVRLCLALCAVPMLLLFIWPAALASPARHATRDIHPAANLTIPAVAKTDETVPRATGPHKTAPVLSSLLPGSPDAQ